MCNDCKNKDENGVIVCRCEEITQEEIERAIKAGCHDLDAVKRATRAGMGMCQSKSCTPVISRMISQIAGIDPAEVRPFTKRSPLRPISMSALADEDGL